MQAGDWIDERYRIIRTLGKGSEGTVYLAMQERIYRFYAIKVLTRDNACFSEEGVEIWKRLSHPGLPEIVDVLENETEIMIVMEYIEGDTFSQIPQLYGIPSVRRIASWGIQICETLQYLHAQNPPIIFGDIKPDNLILCKKKVILVDLGSAIQKDSKGKKTGTQLFYPVWDTENQGKTMIDLYGVGQILGFLASGGIRDIQNPASWLLRRTDSVLKQIIHKCTAAEPKDRYASIQECLKDLKYLYRRSFLLPILLPAALSVLFYASSFQNNREQRLDTAVQYAYKMQEAQKHSGSEKERIFCEAISLCPELPEGYISLLEMDLEDGCFSETEEETLRKVLLQIDDQGMTNEEIIAGCAPVGYGQLAYQLGMAYWYFYENDNGQTYALPWFQKVLALPADIFSDQDARMRSEIYTRIGGYQGKLQQAHITGREEVSFLEYWKDMHVLLELPVTTDDGGLTTLIFYKKYLSQLIRYRLEFIESGVHKEEIEEAFQYVRDNYLQITEKSSVFGEQKRQIKDLLTLLEMENEVSIGE